MNYLFFFLDNLVRDFLYAIRSIRKDRAAQGMKHVAQRPDRDSLFFKVLSQFS